jgi:hypothetical protein
MSWLIILIMAILALLPCPGSAQVYHGLSRDVMLGWDIRPNFTKQFIQLREDQFVKNSQTTRIEFAATAVSLEGLFKAKFVLIPSFSTSETVTPTRTLQIGAVDFGPSQQNQGQQQQSSTNQQKPVEICFQEKANWRLELSGPRYFPIRPMLVLDGAQCEITADGEKDGKKTRSTETFNQVFWGLGGSIRYRQRFTLTEISLVASDRYYRGEGSISQLFRPDFGVTIGYSAHGRSWENLKQRVDGAFVGVIYAF